MPLETDQNGMFIGGMTHPDELGQYLQSRFTEKEIQQTYAQLAEEAKALARSEGVSPLRAFWRLLSRGYEEKNWQLKCKQGCGYCCHTGVAVTQLEWDTILKHVEEKGIDLEQIIERSERTIKRIRETLASGKNLDQVDWHRLVVNQPCPFLDDEQSCIVYEDRPLDCRLVVAFRGVCASKKLEHAQRGVVLEEAVASTVIAKLQHDQTPKFKRRKFYGTQPLRLLQHWLILWQNKKSKKRKK